jgi:hypothetical protein
MAAVFPTSLSSEALLPILTAQLGSELLARQVIRTLEEAAEKEANKRRQVQTTSSSDEQPRSLSPIQTQNTSPITPNLNVMTISNNEQKSSMFELPRTTEAIIIPSSKSSPIITSSPTTILSPSILSSSNILNVPQRSVSQSHTPLSSARSSILRQPSPSTSACSIRSNSSTINSDKPFQINTRGRKRVYTDEERRLRKNHSSKKSREKHTEQVMEKKAKLQQLQEKHRELIEKRKQLDKEIQEHRQHLCPYCLNVVEEALREIGKGQDIVVLKRVNFCCATYHSQQQEDCLTRCQRSAAGVLGSGGSSSNGGGTNDVVIEDTIIKTEPSEFSN